MTSIQRKNSKTESLNDSWVELQFQSQMSLSDGKKSPSSHGSGAAGIDSMSQPIFLQSGQMEKLLLEAQRESSRSTSRPGSTTSSHSSPRSPNSPINELDGLATLQEGQVFQKCQDWIWDWSSRPEAIPPSDYGLRFKRPRPHKYSVPNTEVMRNSVFRKENLPTLFLSHACTFIMGAAFMFMFLRKYVKYSIPTQPLN